MIMLRSMLVGLTAATLLLGCASSGSSSAAVSQAAGSRYPAWVFNPDKPGYQSVVGAAPRQDWGGHAAQYRVAEMKARQELAQMVRVQVESTTRMRLDERAGKVSRDGDVESSLQSKVELNLDAARVIEEWTDPQSGELYIWLAIPK